MLKTKYIIMMSMRPFAKLVKFMAPVSGSRVRSISPYGKNVLNLRKSSSLLLYIYVKNKIHNYDVHEALYQNCEIPDPCVRGSGFRVGPIWPDSKNVLNLKKSSLLQHM